MLIKRRHIKMARAAWRQWADQWQFPCPVNVSSAICNWHLAAKGKHQ